ncbi:MAG: carotenoid 1,2-hydratase, partial [Gammaproteobacteria bacterium]|nr:carotenoid 1,2-hydratase [Gammaproteobacteria bacterium]
MNWPETRSRIAAAAVLLVAACGDSPVDAPAQGLRLAEVLGGTTVDGFQVADRVVPFTFPADQGPHPGFRSEWWYLTVALRSPAGEEFGVQFTLFRQALRPASEADNGDAWRSGQVFLGHLALTDVTRDRHIEAERLARGHPRLAGVRAAPFAAWIEGWRLASAASLMRGASPSRSSAEGSLMGA